MTPKLVIFDCDGVLVDTEGPTNALLAENLTRHGLPISPDQCHELFVGGTIMGVFEVARQKGARLPDDWVDGFYKVIFDRLAQGVPTIPGVLDLLDRLEAKGIAVWVASNGPMRKMQLSLGPSGLWDRFAGRILSREHFAPKPAPDMVLHAIAQSGVQPSEAIMIDDSVFGCQAAVNAGIRCIGFGTTTPRDKLIATGAMPAQDMVEVGALLGV